MEIDNENEMPDYMWAKSYGVLMVKSTIFDTRHRGLIPRINNWLNQSCDMEYNTCQVYKKCDSYVCLALNQNVIKYVPEEKLADLTTWLDNDENSNNIGGMCIVISFDNVVHQGLKGVSEVYSICTRSKDRKQGYASRLLKAISELTHHRQLWLGVLFDNPSFESVVSLYIKYGFGDPLRVNKTPGGANIGFYLLGMTYLKSRKHSNTNLQEVNNLKQLNEVQSCSVTLHIGEKLATHLYEYVVDYAYEYGGVLSVDEVKGQDAYLAYPLATETIGRSHDDTDVLVEHKAFRVLVPNSTINFHTHPRLAYLRNLSYVGWPSGADMGGRIKSFPAGVLKHFLSTNEGIYDIQLTPELMLKLYTLNLDQVNTLGEAVGEVFDRITMYRNADLIDPQEAHLARLRGWFKPFLNLTTKKADILKQFLYVTNTFSIKTLFFKSDNNYQNKLKRYLNPQDETLLFIINFHSWNQIFKGYSAKLVYFKDRNNRSCPLQENTTQYLTPRDLRVITD